MYNCMYHLRGNNINLGIVELYIPVYKKLHLRAAGGKIGTICHSDFLLERLSFGFERKHRKHLRCNSQRGEIRRRDKMTFFFSGHSQTQVVIVQRGIRGQDPRAKLIHEEGGDCHPGRPNKPIWYKV